MVSLEEITFNIIFVPGTVQYLQLFTRSVIKHSPSRFRLVANACSRVERQLLRHLAAQSPRVEVYEVPASQPLRHGILLDHLQRLEPSSTFALMDSDVYATAEFLTSMLADAGDAKAVFSCSPVWCNEVLEAAPNGARLLKGFHNRLHDGFNVGSTYFAIYDNTRLNNLLEETSVSFESHFWDEVPTAVQAELLDNNYKYVHYDSGKLINILLNLRGHRLCNVRTHKLKHVGGISLEALASNRRQADTLMQRFRRAVKRPLRWMLGKRCAKDNWHKQVSAAELSRLAEVKQRRLVVSRYMASMMMALSDGLPLERQFQHEDRQLVTAVRQMQRDVMKLLREHGPAEERSHLAA